MLWKNIKNEVNPCALTGRNYLQPTESKSKTNTCNTILKIYVYTFLHKQKKSMERYSCYRRGVEYWFAFILMNYLNCFFSILKLIALTYGNVQKIYLITVFPSLTYIKCQYFDIFPAAFFLQKEWNVIGRAKAIYPHLCSHFLSHSPQRLSPSQCGDESFLGTIL